jgi:hypothetical protein
MTDRDIDRITASYLEALDREDIDVVDQIWERAATEPDLERALHELHLAQDAEDEKTTAQETVRIVARAVEQHITSAEIVRPVAGAVTVADVADELFRHTPNRLQASAHVLNERLRLEREPLPIELGLSKLTAWAEARFGPAPRDYWKVFREAALKLELRRAAEAEYRLAARPGQPKSEPGHE